MLWACLEAADILAADGIEATVWDPRVIRPLDTDLLDDAARFDHVITIEDGLREGGIGATLAQELADRALTTGHQPLVSVLGTPVEFLTHGSPETILSSLGLDAAGVVATVRRHLG